MKELLSRIVKALVDYPDQVTVDEIESSQTIVLDIAVAKEDLGKIIGQKGRNINAIRTILEGVSGKIKKRVVINIVE